MSRLVLVHGGFHGAWSWDLLLPELQRLGHHCLSLDLPVDRIGAGVDAYVEVICDTMAETLGGDADAVLIGHSLAGTLLPRVPLKRHVSGLIYLCPAIPPRDAAEHEENLAAFGTGLTDRFRVDDHGIVTITPDDAIFAFYHDVSPEAARWAATKLRPQWAGAMSTSYAPLDTLPDVPSRAIICTDDRVLQLDKTRRLIRQRLHVDPVEFPGGHSPFLSRPAELAAVLDRLIQDFAHP